MSTCFICYCDANTDTKVALYLHEFLIKHGHQAFLDRKMLIGTKWPKEIEKQIKSSDYFIVLLSKESILSDMVIEEVNLAHSEMQKRKDIFKILPIRLNFIGDLPYDLGAYLNRIQYVPWMSGDSLDTVAGIILNAIERYESLPNKRKPDETPGIKNLYDLTEARGAPLLKMDPRFSKIEMDTCAVKSTSDYYIERKSDELMREQLSKRGSTTIITGSWQMGKSSLLVRAHSESIKHKHRVHFFDFQSMDNDQLASLETLLKSLARELSENLGTFIKPDECWNNSLGSKRNFTNFIEECLIDKKKSVLSLFFDDVDRIFEYPFREDFFSTIRHWDTLRAIGNKCWNLLNIVISHSTEPYLWIKDLNQSPFNVGFPIKMEDFGKPEVNKLNERYMMPLKSDKEIEELIILTGGQPYLVRMALYKIIKENYSMEQLKKVSADDSGPFGDHLRRFIWYLKDKRDMKKSLNSILKKGFCEDEEQFLRLRASGMVKGESRNRAEIRCQLYDQYFRKHL